METGTTKVRKHKPHARPNKIATSGVATRTAALGLLGTTLAKRKPADGEMKKVVKRVEIKPSNMQIASFELGPFSNSPLVIHRFSKKAADEIEQKMREGRTSKKPKREPVDFDLGYEQAKYVHVDGWTGVNAAAFRNSMIRACDIKDYKMIRAKMSIFILEDGWDKIEPWYPLVRIYGQPEQFRGIAYTSTGEPYMSVRALYRDYKIKLRIRWDADQFTLKDVTNLLVVAGDQVGICEGRPASKHSCGMGWGRFEISKLPPQLHDN